MRKVYCVIVAVFILNNSSCFVTRMEKVDTNKTSSNNSTRSSTNVTLTNLEVTHKAYEKEVLQNGDQKTNNLSERSFIWIKTRFNSPLRYKDEYEYKPFSTYDLNDHEAMGINGINGLIENDIMPVQSMEAAPFFSPNVNFENVLCKIPNYRALEEKFRSKCRNFGPNGEPYDTNKIDPIVPENETEKIVINENVGDPDVAFGYDKKPHYSTSLVRYKTKDLKNPYHLRRSTYNKQNDPLYLQQQQQQQQEQNRQHQQQIIQRNQLQQQQHQTLHQMQHKSPMQHQQHLQFQPQKDQLQHEQTQQHLQTHMLQQQQHMQQQQMEEQKMQQHQQILSKQQAQPKSQHLKLQQPQQQHQQHQQNSNTYVNRYPNQNVIDSSDLNDADKLLEYIKETLAGNIAKDQEGAKKCTDCKKKNVRKNDYNRKPTKMRKGNNDKQRRGRERKHKKNHRQKQINVGVDKVNDKRINKTNIEYDEIIGDDVDKIYLEDILRTNNEINNLIH